MRHFKLINNKGDELNITSQSIFFHDIEGLGFEEETSYRRIGQTWWLNNALLRQTPITGKVSFTDIEGFDPYTLFNEFYLFINKTPLILAYYPRGLGETAYRKQVRVTKLDKSELNKYGILEEDISFTPYTPWYMVTRVSNISTIIEGTGWVWGGDDSPPLVFEPTDELSTPAKFGGEISQSVRLYSPVESSSPIKLTIKGPAINPIWSHYVGNKLISTGGFSGAGVNLSSEEELVGDNTDGHIQMYIRNLTTGESRNVYALRDFNTTCFFVLKEGDNTISVATSGGSTVDFTVEGHIYYGTV